MSVVLDELKLHNFRNHSSFILNQPKKTVIIIGRNATGKTNIIEALQLISRMDSFRNPKWQNLVQTGADTAFIQAKFIQNERLLDIQMDIQEGRRVYSLNDKKRIRTEIVGLVPAVLFIPDDLALVKDSSVTRRNLIDRLGEQLSSTYRQISSDYQKIVKQRNGVLKEQRETGSDLLILESWDESLIQVGALLFVHRIKLSERLMDRAKEYYRELSQGEELSVDYSASFLQEGDETELIKLSKEKVEELLRVALFEARNDELARGLTLVGPHRDEIVFFIDGYDARHYGSQGQQRSIALSLKLAELALIQEISGNQPLLLLDDVLSELDEQRRMALIKIIDGHLQTFITATDLSCFNEEILENSQIIDLDGKDR